MSSYGSGWLKGWTIADGVLCTLCDFPVSKDSRWHKQIKGSLSPRLDCSAVVISHCNLKLLGSGDSPISDSQATGTTEALLGEEDRGEGQS
ncbi:putative uncharacterized protein CCDC28A-AS1 isoform X2 [Macaca fascicularis]|uniref:putative uncharacterized protein CCDC28A-AS1 isoform X2 n=1 Tax=Macaca fascicularis TaxID=9541 RepID=UPI0032B06C8A